MLENDKQRKKEFLLNEWLMDCEESDDKTIKLFKSIDNKLALLVKSNIFGEQLQNFLIEEFSTISKDIEFAICEILSRCPYLEIEKFR